MDIIFMYPVNVTKADSGIDFNFITESLFTEKS